VRPFESIDYDVYVHHTRSSTPTSGNNADEWCDGLTD
jgi:hypothetical protein